MEIKMEINIEIKMEINIEIKMERNQAGNQDGKIEMEIKM